MKSFTFIVIAIGMVCTSAQDTTLVKCSDVLTSSDCTQVSPKSSFYTSAVCGFGENIDGCNVENCCGEVDFCIEDFVGDGDCDPGNNNAECGNFDGGDCCECTCMDTQFSCGGRGFNCQDPNIDSICGIGELPMGPCDTPCVENCNLDWICTSTSTFIPGLE